MTIKEEDVIELEVVPEEKVKDEIKCDSFHC